MTQGGPVRFYSGLAYALWEMGALVLPGSVGQEEISLGPLPVMCLETEKQKQAKLIDW